MQRVEETAEGTVGESCESDRAEGCQEVRTDCEEHEGAKGQDSSNNCKPDRTSGSGGTASSRSGQTSEARARCTGDSWPKTERSLGDVFVTAHGRKFHTREGCQHIGSKSFTRYSPCKTCQDREF